MMTTAARKCNPVKKTGGMTDSQKLDLILDMLMQLIPADPKKEAEREAKFLRIMSKRNHERETDRA
jgi:hypothetical protein